MKPLQVKRFVRVSPHDHHRGQQHADTPPISGGANAATAAWRLLLRDPTVGFMALSEEER